MSTKAIRIQHPLCGEGLWRTNVNDRGILRDHSQYVNIQKRHGNPDKFPTLSQDDVLIEQVYAKDISTRDYYFAFLSLDQLKEALTSEELKECINSLGFRVLLLELSDCIASPFQIIFKKEDVLNSEDISFMFL